MMRAAALLSLTVAAAASPATVAAQVRGQVTDAASGDPVVGALVWLAGGTIHLDRSSVDGTYEFTDAPPGSYCLRVNAPGYDRANVCISVSADARMIVDVPLSVRPVAIAPLIVTGRRGTLDGSTGEDESLQAFLTVQDLAISATRTRALAAAQLGDLAHSSMSDPTAGGRPHALYVWGSSADRGRVLLDGATLNAPLHLGALLPPLDPGIVAAADVHSGGISPRYDGGTSYIMDFTTRPAAPDAAVWGQLDMIAGRIGAETPIGSRGGLILSARRVNDEVIDELVSSSFGYGYADALARADLDLGSGSGLHMTALTTHEAVRIPRDLAEDRASWDNHAATLEWNRNDAGDSRTAQLSVSRGIADLPLLSAIGGHLEASLDRFSAMAERNWRAGALQWTAGAELEHLAFQRRSRAQQDPLTGQPGPVECTAALPCSRSRATFASTFAEVSLSPMRRMQASIGTRAMYDVDAGRVHLLPRASLTLLPSQEYSITLSGGRFSQAYVRHQSASGEEGGDVRIDVDVAHATHLELGFARHAAGTYLRAGAYLRHHESAAPTAQSRTVPGADVSLEYTSPVGTVSFAYSISGGTAPVRAPSAQDTTSRDAMLQQLATAGFRGDHGRWQLELSASYGSGLPLTSIVLEQPVDDEVVLQPSPYRGGGVDEPMRADESYLRVDASIGAEWRIGDDGDGGGARIVPYARIINALGQRESLFYFQDADGAGAPRGLARLPAVPILGVRWHF